MATAKRRKPKPRGKTPPTFQPKPKKSFSAKAMTVLGILIALSMVLALVVNIGSSGF